MKPIQFAVTFFFLLLPLSLFCEDSWDTVRSYRGWQIWERTDPIYSTRHFKYSTSFEQRDGKAMTVYMNLRQLTESPTYLLTITFEYFETQDNPPESCIIRFGDSKPQVFDVSPLLFGRVLWINNPFKFHGEAEAISGRGILRYRIKGTERDFTFDFTAILPVLREDIGTILNNPLK